jgi:hypothetical protein
MPRKRHWLIEGQEVTRADIRRWMASVGSRCPDGLYWSYVRDYAVVRKIATAKAEGTFEQIIREESQRMQVDVPRAARSPSTIWRVRRAWPAAANESTFGDELEQPMQG